VSKRSGYPLVYLSRFYGNGINQKPSPNHSTIQSKTLPTKSLNVPTLKASEWLPDTKVMKEQLASAASQIKTAVGDMEGQTPARADSQPRGASAQALTSSSSTVSSSGSSAPADEEPLVVQDMSQAKRATTPQPGAINLRESPRHRQDSASAERRRQQPPLPSQTASQQSTPTEARDVCSLSIRI
jgi:hypothetical protein